MKAPVVHLMSWQVLFLTLKARWYVVIVNNGIWLSMLTVEQMVLWATNRQPVWISLIRFGALFNDLSQVISYLHNQFDLWAELLLFDRCVLSILGSFNLFFSL